jgi:hypothetical protein
LLQHTDKHLPHYRASHPRGQHSLMCKSHVQTPRPQQLTKPWNSILFFPHISEWYEFLTSAGTAIMITACLVARKLHK